jgi:mono/diheme cytochrome c family protein
MSLPHQKPDLEDSINVTEAHGRVVREAAACAREKRISENGNESIPIGPLIACGIAAFLAGGIFFGSKADLFSYGAVFQPGYVRSAAPGKGDTGPLPKEALAAYSAKGAKIFSSKCSGCHGSDAKGNGSTYPSLIGSKWVLGETQRFAMVILNGLQGPVSNGTTYGVMPPQGIGMAPEDLAGIMTYMRNNMGNSSGDVITTDMAKAAIDISAARKKAGQSVTADELTADHIKALAGAALDPKTMLDPVTLAPAKAP